ncbi:hypothetical protein D3C87_1714150 [compost metagenome]
MDIARHTRRFEILGLMAGAAAQRRCATTINAACDPRRVRPHGLGLRRPIGSRMTVHAARVLDHATRFLEQRYRSRPWIGDRIEVGSQTQALDLDRLQPGRERLCLRHGAGVKRVDKAARSGNHDHSE